VKRDDPAKWRELGRGTMDSKGEVARLLVAVKQGDRDALNKLIPLVYEELRRIAHRQLRNEGSDRTLTTTALVHEAYLKLFGGSPIDWQSRAHFFAISARAMRRVLVNYAVSRKAQKRGRGQPKVSLDEAMVMADERSEDVLALDEALQRLEAIDARHGRVVECLFFGGLSIAETAEALEVSPATVKRDWNMARAWLNRELSG
jgi:RNA polymerase sigma-70 factor, ECF subfamily